MSTGWVRWRASRPQASRTSGRYSRLPSWRPYLAPKGSVSVDGVSLTVNTVEDLPDGRVRFLLNIIPHTEAHTTLGQMRPGTKVNLEADTLARYIRRMEALTHG